MGAGASSTKAAPPEASSLQSQSQSQSQSQTPEPEPEWAESTVFSTVDASELFAVFRRRAQVDSAGALALDSTAFAAALHELRSRARFRDLSASSETFAERLFHVLDADRNGVLDVREFLHGLGLLTRGSLPEKIRLSFDLFDANGDGRISRGELTEMIRSSFLAAVRTLRAEASQTEADVCDLRERADQVARTFTREAFATLGSDESLGLDDFERFAATAPAIRATLNGRARSVDVTLV
jgi:Ca2+-binding EF-hand superfamily protein